MKSAIYFQKRMKSCISDIDSRKSEFCNNPGIDFTRNRKMTFKETISFILSLSSCSLPAELRRYFQSESKMPTKSAFIQQRQKIAPEAFRALFDEFNASIKMKNSFRGFRLLACDGTDVNLPHNPEDAVTSIRANPNAKSYNTLHINA